MLELPLYFIQPQILTGTLPTLYYIPDFISDLQQSQILHHIYEAPVTKWKTLKNRRLQNWGGVVHEKGLLPQDLPPWLKGVTNKICDMTGLFPSPINHVLINEYLPDQGIMPHQDGPAYFPVVAILSLGSSAVMDFTPHVRLRECMNERNEISGNSTGNIYNKGDGCSEDRDCGESADHLAFSLLLKPCSLLIFKDKAYSDYLHGIEDSHIHKPDKVNACYPKLQYRLKISIYKLINFKCPRYRLLSLIVTKVSIATALYSILKTKGHA
ncbi:hypothetical protein QJS04_geneDACA015136 [Acorus gramineus]|uniref:Alpha-ketoglutarate-dependent dioxygenase AlkB-like domain-containing protein n=1 Tax=Acorus gramineus TaxID=55184 RepID=A0AAV9BSW7_ACOGR|nr:hypothetical protein QJS04_geneDACA015136 [Acorus gramineus]